jgi:hypothetical protein
MPGNARGDSMPDIQPRPRQVPSIVPDGVPRKTSRQLPAMSDDECLVRLAQAVAAHDTERLNEVARLIGRLAVAIE